MLFKMKKLTPRVFFCVCFFLFFCGTELETLQHFFFYYSKVGAFWDEVTVMLSSQGITFRPFDLKTLFLSRQLVTVTALLDNIILESKYFIYRTKPNKTSLSLKLLFEKIKSTFQIERFLARKNNKLLIHENKWKPLLQLIQQQIFLRLYYIIIHQTHSEKSDLSRSFNQFTIACELDMINAISAADIALNA